MMMKDHKKDNAKYDKAQQEVTDADIKEYIDNTLPVLKHHLRMAENLQQQID